MKVIRINESDFKNIIKESVKRIVKEEYGFDDFAGLSDDEYNELQQQFIDAYEKEDEDMKDDYESSMADMINPDDYNYCPSDGDLYRYGM